MEHKELGTNVEGSTSVSDGSTKIAFRTKSYNVESNSLAKVDATTSRPCAIIGPDRVLQPNSNDVYLKKTLGESWISSDNVYRHPPEYPNKVSDYQPTRNISPRQTFQENMQRIMVPPTFSSMKSSDDSSLQNIKPNMPQEAKYCDVPYSVNSVTNEHKNVRNPDIPMPNMNPAFTRNIPPPYGWPAGVNVRHLRPYGAPEFQQYTEYPSCTGPRPMSMIRPHRSLHEESAQAFSERLYQDANIRFKPYPTGKEQLQQSRYDYINNYPNTFHPPASFPPHKYELQKTMHGHSYSVYPQVPLKYLDRRIHEPFIEGYHRSPNQQINFNTFHSQIVPPPYGTVPGNCMQSKSYSEIPSKHMTINKMQFENNNKVYLNLDSSRNKSYPIPENYFYNDVNQPLRGEILLPTHPASNIHPTPQHPIYRKDNTSLKSYEYNSHYRNFEQSINLNHSLSKVPLQFSSANIAISPSDSNTSNDTVHTLGTQQDDCGYVSQSSTASTRSLDSMNMSIPHDIYRRHSYNNYGIIRNTFHNNGSEQISKHKINSLNKKNLNVRQFLQMWNEGDDEVNESNKEATAQNHGYKYPNQSESVKNQEQLYVLGLVNVPNEELDKYNHIQKISKLPENIKGYDNIEILNQYEKLLESPLLSNFNKHTAPRDFKTFSKSMSDRENTPKIPRPISPLDVEAKISQSVIHKEVGCNFEIKPCSPEMMSVEVAAPVQTLLNERMIEKVINPIVSNAPILPQKENSNAQSRSGLNDSNKNASCKLISGQYMPDHCTDKLKANNYTMQDLESNSGICLASLPQLDNDIELNFPEINQQFIKANKIDSISAPIIQDLPRLDIEQSNHSNNVSQTIESNLAAHPLSSQSQLYNTSDKEFSKLSKYRKSKKFELTDNQDTIKPNESSALQRIDSVIIKNPDNIKLQDTESITLQGNKIQEIEQHSRYPDINVMSPATAIDFSLNRTGGETATERNENCRESLLKKNDEIYNNDIREQINETKLNNISSFPSNLEEILIARPCSTSSEKEELYKASESQYDCSIDVQTDSSTVNILSEKNSVHVITKVVSNLETSIDCQIGHNKINNTDITISATDGAMSATDIVTPKESIQECKDSNFCISTKNTEESVKAPLISESMVENIELQFHDIKAIGNKNQSKISNENKDGCDLAYTGNINDNDDKKQASSINSKIEDCLEAEERESRDDLHLNETIPMDVSTEHTAEFDIEIENVNKSTDITVTESNINHSMQENDVHEPSTTLGIPADKNQDNVSNIFNTKNIQNPLNSSKDEEKTEVFENVNIENICCENLQNVTGMHENDIKNFEIGSHEKLNTTNSTTECDPDHLEICNSSVKVLDYDRKEPNLDFPELEREGETNNREKCEFNNDIENEVCSSIKDYTNLDHLDYKSTTIGLEESGISPEVVQQAKTHESFTTELTNVSENINIHNKDEMCVFPLNYDVPLEENTQKLKSNFIEINCEMKCNQNISTSKNEICVSSIQELSPEQNPISELEECKYELISNSNIMNIDNDTLVNLEEISNDQEIDANIMTKCSKIISENTKSYQCYPDLVQDKKNIFTKNNVSIRKELYSPWIQKLLIFTEGLNNTITYVDNKSTDEDLSNDGKKKILYENLERKEGVEHKNIQKAELLNDVIENKTQIDQFEDNVFSPTSSVKEVKSDACNTLTPFTDCNEITINERDSDFSKEADNCNKREIDEKFVAVDSRTLIKPNKILKRSLSESALEEYKNNDDTNTFQPCKRRRINPTILQSHVITEDICNIIQTNRRNSISTFYNEENVYIVIDNDLIITDDESSEKLCYTQIEEDYSTNIQSTIDEININLETVYSDESTKIEFSDGLQNGEQPSDESWVEDIGCVETDFSEDVAENIIIDTQSPRKIDDIEIESDETQTFYDSEHIDKIRNIYGSTMCNDDTQLIETLYKTPQMDVNKTLHYIESHNPEEFLENSFNETHLDSNNQNTDIDKTSSISDINKENMSKNSNMYFEKCQQIYYPKCHEASNVEYNISSLQHDKEYESSNENLVSSVKEDSNNYSCSSSPEVSSTTSEEKNSSILLKITNCNGSIVSEINEINCDKRSKISYKLTETGEYRNYNSNFSSSRTLITKAAQKYIPPLKDLKVKLHLSQQRLNTLKELKSLKAESKLNASIINFSNTNLKPDILKKQKPKFEDVLKSIDEINSKRHKHQNKKSKNSIPKVIIKKNENGAHYASNKSANRKEAYNPDLTGLKWQPWVFLEKNNFIDGMALKNKVKAVYCHRKNSYVLAEKFRKYKSIYNANFVITQPNSDCSSKGNLKYTIRLKQN